MKKLLTVSACFIICTSAFSQDKMNKKMDNKSDQMNKTMDNKGDKMNKKLNSTTDTTTKKVIKKTDKRIAAHKTA